MQSDIATRVAQALGGAFGAGVEKRLSERPTRNLAAYDAFLLGEKIWNSTGEDAPSVRRSLVFYERAVNRILDDLSAACRPRWMEVVGDFAVRGGIKSVITASVGTKR